MGKKFTIKVSKWIRNGLKGDSVLCDDEGNKCCLGFYLQSCGVKVQDLVNQPTPSDILYKDTQFPKQAMWLLEKYVTGNYLTDSQAGSKLMGANDRLKKGLEYTKKRVSSLFKKQGIEVKFVD